jgi:hypothetical protein
VFHARTNYKKRHEKERREAREKDFYCSPCNHLSAFFLLLWGASAKNEDLFSGDGHLILVELFKIKFMSFISVKFTIS